MTGYLLHSYARAGYLQWHPGPREWAWDGAERAHGTVLSYGAARILEARYASRIADVRLIPVDDRPEFDVTTLPHVSLLEGAA